VDVSGDRVLRASALEGWERVMQVLLSELDIESDNVG